MTSCTNGGRWEWTRSFCSLVVLVPAGVVTMTSWLPNATPAGTVATISLALLTDTSVSAVCAGSLSLTALAQEKFCPAMVTWVA